VAVEHPGEHPDEHPEEQRASARVEVKVKDSRNENQIAPHSLSTAGTSSSGGDTESPPRQSREEEAATEARAAREDALIAEHLSQLQLTGEVDRATAILHEARRSTVGEGAAPLRDRPIPAGADEREAEARELVEYALVAYVKDNMRGKEVTDILNLAGINPPALDEAVGRGRSRRTRGAPR
jgi:hypothetical protein